MPAEAFQTLQSLQESHERRIELLLQQHQVLLLDGVQALLDEVKVRVNASAKGRVTVRGPVATVPPMDAAATEVAGPSITAAKTTVRGSLQEEQESRSRFFRFSERKRNMEETADRFQQAAAQVADGVVQASHDVRSIFVADIDNADSEEKTLVICKLIQRVVASRTFEVLVTVVVLANSITLGLQADWAMRHIGLQDPPAFDMTDGMFTVIFIVELFLRIVAYGRFMYHYENRNFGWNVFDTALVFVSLINYFCALLLNSGMSQDLAAIRLLRVLRLMRVLRVVRVLRFFSDLRLILASIAISMKSLLWALILHLVLEFIFGVVIMDFVSQYMNDNLDAMLGDSRAGLFNDFGTMGASLATLFMSMSGGREWYEVARHLSSVSEWLAVFFASYIAISVFCILNIITALFVENAKKLTLDDDLQLFMQSMENRKEWLNGIEKLFNAITPEDEEVFTVANLKDRIKDIHLQSMFEKFGLDVEVENAQGLFQLLDLDENGAVDLDEFALGVQMLHGGARSIDVARLRHSTDFIVKELAYLRGIICDEIDVTEQSTGRKSLKSATTRTSIKSSVNNSHRDFAEFAS